MKPVPRKPKDDEDSISELKKQNEAPIIKDQDKDQVALIQEQDRAESVEVVKKENGYLTVLKNAPFLCVMLANLPAVMGLYIPYMFLPGVSVSLTVLNISYFLSDHCVGRLYRHQRLT